MSPTDAAAAILSGTALSGLVVDGSLRLRGVACASMPDGLAVREDLVLEGCGELAALPEGLRVGEMLWVRGCPKLREWPRQVSVGRHCYLLDCPALESAVFERDIGGDLMIDNCPRLGTLGRALVTGGSCRVSGCPSLRSLPERVRVGGVLDLQGLLHLQELPSDLRVETILNLRDCPSVTAFPESLLVGDHVVVSIGTALERAPAPFGVRVRVDRRLVLSGDPNLTTFDQPTEVNGSLLLARCVNLTGLPPNLRVDWELDLSNCESLRQLPPGLHVGRDLCLRGCTKLASLPKDLFVGRALVLAGCLSVELPEGLRVGGDLILTGCPQIRSLPRGLHVGGCLRLDRPLAKPEGASISRVAIRGVEIPTDLLWNPEKITLEMILPKLGTRGRRRRRREPSAHQPRMLVDMENVERRRLLLELYGLERFIRDIHAAVVDAVNTDEFVVVRDGRTLMSKITGLKGARLHRVALPDDEPLVMLELQNSTPEPDGSRKTYMLRVPPHMRTCREAVAWSFDLPADGYAPSVET